MLRARCFIPDAQDGCSLRVHRLRGNKNPLGKESPRIAYLQRNITINPATGKPAGVCNFLMPVSYTHLVRAYNCLKRAGINSVAELVQRNQEDMMKVRNLGRKSLEEVEQKLEALGLGLRPNEE